LKLIVDLIYEGGIAKMHQFISETAKYGDITRGSRIIDQRVRDNMKKVLGEIQSGQFAKEWIAEDKAGRPNYKQLLEKDKNHPIEKVGEELRRQMSWLRSESTAAARGTK
jgi:ketol-acid reductoisomerase